MKRNFGTLTLLLFVILTTATIGCERTNQQMIPIGPVPSDGMMSMGPVDDEESTVQLALTDIYDNIRNGAHLIMAYHPASNSFKGTVTNITAAILPLVRVEIHLSKGGVTTAELGPTTPTDLAPGETQDIVLMAEGPPFDMWTAHPEVGPMSGGGGEGGAEGPEGGVEGGEGVGGSEGGGEHGQGTGGEGPEGGGN